MSSASAASSPTSFESLVPGRVLETRVGEATVDGQFAGIGLRAAGSVTELLVAGRAGVGPDAVAVVLNVAVTGAQAAGFITVFPCGQARPLAASLNYDAGQTISNAVTAKIGEAGTICVFTLAATHVIIDVTGAYPPGASFESLVPGRVLETRVGEATVDGQFAGIGLRAAGSVTELLVAGRAGVGPDAVAVVLNVAVTGAQAAGFITVFPCGQARPLAASLNYDAGQTISNAVTAKIGEAGTICVFTLAATHVIIDVTGAYPPGASFESLVPGRVLETRVGEATVDGQFAGIGCALRGR